MTRRQRFLVFAVLCMGMATSVMGAEPSAPPDAVPGAVTLDSVTLKDGTVIYGQVLGMVADELHIKTSFGPTGGDDIVKIMWTNVAKTSGQSSHPVQPEGRHHGGGEPHNPVSPAR